MQVGEFKRESLEKHYGWREAIIFPDGDIRFAQPSHLQIMERIYKKAHGCTTDELYVIMPESASPIMWLTEYTGCICIYPDGYYIPSVISKKANRTLKLLFIDGFIADCNFSGRPYRVNYLD